MTESDVPVCIVGAGPVGLTIGARLASFGIPSVTFEVDPHLRKQGSKACLIQGDALEILDKIGCAEAINAEGVTWHVARTYVRNKVIRTTVHLRPIGFGPFVNISQYRIEQMLLDRVRAEPLCQLRWAHRVVGVAQDGKGVVVRADTPDGLREERFRYVIAADGVRSAVRELTGVAWTGYSHKDRFLITDIQADLPLAKERHFHYDPSFNPGRQLVIHPQPNSIWRIDWQLAPDADVDIDRTSGAFDRRVRAVIGDIPYEVDWASTYRFHQRVVEQLRVGRIFFAGDAAHALPPYGSRGMNSGIQDADNLAWKLAHVLHGHAGDSLLDTYHTERYAAAKENLRVTEATIKFMIPPSLPRRLARAALLRLAHPIKSARDRINSGTMAEPFVYTDSSIVDAAAGHPLVGRFAPDGWVSVAGHRERLRRLFGAEFVGLYLGADAFAARRFVMDALADQPVLPARLVLVVAAGTSIDVSDLPGPVVVAVDEGGLHSTYHADQPRWLLVRPDGHIASAFEGGRGAEFNAALRRAANEFRSADTTRQPTNHALPQHPRLAQEPSMHRERM
jgi:2-polyprenyl-6-methoxyphenol hydroxylase-like FAD-dependent oxidoreductase